MHLRVGQEDYVENSAELYRIGIENVRLRWEHQGCRAEGRPSRGGVQALHRGRISPGAKSRGSLYRRGLRLSPHHETDANTGAGDENDPQGDHQSHLRSRPRRRHAVRPTEGWAGRHAREPNPMPQPKAAYEIWARCNIRRSRRAFLIEDDLKETTCLSDERRAPSRPG